MFCCESARSKSHRFSNLSRIPVAGDLSLTPGRRLRGHVRLWRPNFQTLTSHFLVIRCGPSSSSSSAVAPTNSKHSGATGKQHYLKANPSHGEGGRGARGNYKLCMSSRHATCITHSCTHSGRHTPRPPNHSAHFLTISSLSSATHTHTHPPPSLHVILCHSPCAKLH